MAAADQRGAAWAVMPMDDFISEDDLQTFEGWLRYQAVSPSSAEELEVWRRDSSTATP